jgi:hypothetical protein
MTWIDAGLCFAMAACFTACGGSTKAKPQEVWKPESRALVNGPVRVEAGKSWEIDFTIDSTMRNVSIGGEFEASGGSGNDIRVAIAEKGQYKNWVNGHAAEVLYQTDQTTTGRIDIKAGPTNLVPGEYTIGFNNRFSVFSDKTVSANIVLKYERIATEGGSAQPAPAPKSLP